MAIITTYPDDAATSSDDKFLTVDSSGATKLTSAATLKTYVENELIPENFANDSIPASAINFGGAGTGVWWEEIGRTTLGSAGDTVSVTSIPARKYLKVLINLRASGTIQVSLRFNNDTITNYSMQRSTNFGAGTTSPSQDAIYGLVGSSNEHMFAEFEIVNVAANEKEIIGRQIYALAGAGNAPGTTQFLGKWSNTSAQISRIDCINLSGTGDYAIGSEVVVLGHD